MCNCSTGTAELFHEDIDTSARRAQIVRKQNFKKKEKMTDLPTRSVVETPTVRLHSLQTTTL